MVRIFYVFGLVFVYMGVLIVLDVIVEVYEVVFSDDFIIDFVKGNIDFFGFIC